MKAMSGDVEFNKQATIRLLHLVHKGKKGSVIASLGDLCGEGNRLIEGPLLMRPKFDSEQFDFVMRFVTSFL
ncbi:Uncharacterized protein TCM_031951 [Theobroma cacao]|uniref:Uncharacterized protein n=1 Tax=Theobroma cacao TaxID=3641 RepID=A0A061F9I8_THECC|nr:Uncharacterized protein TCM_031951 [Theobroma cacao]